MQVSNGIERVKAVIPRLSLLAQGGTAVGTVSLAYHSHFVHLFDTLSGLEHEEGL